MGLDNGIYVEAKNHRAEEWLKDFADTVDPNMDTYVDAEGITAYEFAYWRKCYNIRRRILDTFKDKEYDGQGGEMYFDSEWDLEKVIDVLKFFLSEDNWNEVFENEGYWDGGCIWEWHVVIRSLANQIFILREFLIALVNEEEDEDDPITIDDFKIYFEDSY